MQTKTSNISGFYKLSPEERLKIVKEFANLSDEEIKILEKTGSLDIETANRMIENVIGTVELPFGIATNFLINGKDYLIPMSLDEPSVVAAASYAAKLARPGGGFFTETDEPIMIGQVQIVNIENVEKAKKNILSNRDEIIKIANEKDPGLLKYGGGTKDIELFEIDTTRGKMLIAHILIDVADAYGPNAVNTICEAIAPKLEELSEGDVKLRIVSNLATKRLARAKAIWKKDVIGEDTIENILDAYAFALTDMYRCATHNKGIMNGIDAVAIATTNDFRGLEAGAHAYAAITGKYKPLTKYEKNENGDLVGTIELPVPVGIVGGAINTNPTAKIALKILGVKSARELSGIMAAVGLAQNFAALRALSTEGIQKGHMRLHAKNIVSIAGAKGDLIDKVAEQMIKEGNISVGRAKEILNNRKK